MKNYFSMNIHLDEENTKKLFRIHDRINSSGVAISDVLDKIIETGINKLIKGE